MSKPPEPLAPDLSLLAALDRAELHNPRRRPGKKDAARPDIARHLGFEWHSGTARRLKAQLESLEADRCVVLGKRIPERSLVSLTRRGLTRLQRTRREAVAEAMLPEAPQHRAWREAREAAVISFDEFLGVTTRAVQDAETLLYKPAGGSSEELMRIGDRLRREFWRLASATYCLREWPEPDDGRRDSDEWSGRGGLWLHPRREVAFWADEKLFGEPGL